MNKFFTVAGVAMVAFASQAASAQVSEKDIAAYAALMSTPHGSLPAVASPLMAGEARTGAALDARYGRYSVEGSDVTTNTFGLGGNFAAGERGRVGLMLARSADSCDLCEGSTIMAGVDYSMSLFSRPVGASTTSSLNVGIHPAVGYGKISDGTDVDVNAMSFALDVPVSYAFGMKSGMQIVSFVAPGMGYGRLSANSESLSGTRPSVGGGVGLLNIGNGLGVNLGFRKVFLEEAPTQWGLGMSWNR